MMKFLIVTIIIVSLMSCGTSQHTKSDFVVQTEKSVLSNENTSAAWLAYGLALIAWKPVFLSNGSPDFFQREIYARETTAQIWKELKQNGKVPDANLDALEKIKDADFMPEYLWVYIRKEDWFNPGNLRLQEFKQWAVLNLVGHVPVLNPGVSVREQPKKNN